MSIQADACHRRHVRVLPIRLLFIYDLLLQPDNNCVHGCFHGFPEEEATAAVLQLPVFEWQ
mgnify:CR=1 FL=1|jgi:hypothetical protein